MSAKHTTVSIAFKDPSLSSPLTEGYCTISILVVSDLKHEYY